jgi:Domain of unknown function (DUF4153)
VLLKTIIMNEQIITTNEIPDGIIHASSSTRKGSLLTFLLWALLITNLFFEEVMALNAAILCLISVPLFGFLDPKRLKRSLWWWSAIMWMITAFAVFSTASALSQFSYFLAFLFFTAVNHTEKISLPLALTQSLLSLGIGLAKSVENIIDFFTNKKVRKGSSRAIKFFTYSIPVVIGIVFLKLYQSADKTFYEYTEFLNLDWISWKFLFYYGFTSFFTYGFFYYSQHRDILNFDKSLANEIPENYTDKIERYLGVVNEAKIASSILITLNVLLLLYNFIDVKYVLVDLHDPQRSMIFSEVVHNGINSLIASLVLVIIIISFLFRGGINFSGNKLIKTLGVIWLLQNALMIITTSVKNWEYVSSWGLTHKRIGVFVYLLLALIGLSLALYKIFKKKSFWFLLRNTSLAFMLVLVSLTTFSWPQAISRYNLANLTYEKIDFQYLYELGPATYKPMTDYHSDETPIPNGVLSGIVHSLDYELASLTVNQEHLTWRSFCLLDYQLDRELSALKAISPEVEHNLDRYEW